MKKYIIFLTIVIVIAIIAGYFSIKSQHGNLKILCYENLKNLEGEGWENKYVGFLGIGYTTGCSRYHAESDYFHASGNPTYTYLHFALKIPLSVVLVYALFFTIYAAIKKRFKWGTLETKLALTAWTSLAIFYVLGTLFVKYLSSPTGSGPLL